MAASRRDKRGCEVRGARCEVRGSILGRAFPVPHTSYLVPHTRTPFPRAPLNAPAPMIDLYYWTTPNGHKITLFLEEAGLEYTIKPINIGKGEQFQPGFLGISPNNRIPAIVDHAPADGGKPVSVFESGAILLYLAGKIGKFIPKDLRGQVTTLEWLMWQMGGLG